MNNNLIKDFQRKQKCIFIHIPKAAGTSIEKAIFQTDKWLSGHIKARDYLQSNPKEFKNLFSFGFVRNPHDRLVSAFFYLKKGGGNIEDLQWSQKHIQKYNSFEQFVLDLENIKTRNKIFNWIHFIPQHCFLCDDQKNILVNFIGKVENIHKDFQFVLLRLNIKRTLTTSNSSNHRHYLSYYNKTTYKIVYKLYQYDYELFNYNSEVEKIKEDFSFFFKVQLFLKKIYHNLKFYLRHPKKFFRIEHESNFHTTNL